MTPHIFGT